MPAALLNHPSDPSVSFQVESLGLLPYSLIEVADMLGVDYLSVYRLIQRGKLKACRALRGKFLVTRTELMRMLNKE
jgi:excisionase family DNA binding protein